MKAMLKNFVFILEAKGGQDHAFLKTHPVKRDEIGLNGRREVS